MGPGAGAFRGTHRGLVAERVASRAALGPRRTHRAVESGQLVLAPPLAQNTARGIDIDATTAIPGWYGESIDLDRVVTWLLWSADHSYANFGTLPADQPANLYQRQPLIGTRI